MLCLVCFLIVLRVDCEFFFGIGWVGEMVVICCRLDDCRGEDFDWLCIGIFVNFICWVVCWLGLLLFLLLRLLLLFFFICLCWCCCFVVRFGLSVFGILFGNKLFFLFLFFSVSLVVLGVWKYLEVMVVGIGGEWVFLMRVGFGCYFVDLKGVELRKFLFKVKRCLLILLVILFK